jgi:hypothetical protein
MVYACYYRQHHDTLYTTSYDCTQLQKQHSSSHSTNSIEILKCGTTDLILPLMRTDSTVVKLTLQPTCIQSTADLLTSLLSMLVFVVIISTLITTISVRLTATTIATVIMITVVTA